MPGREEIDWSSFFRLYRPLALRVARGLVGSPERSEELVQEAARAIVERARRAAPAYQSLAHARNAFLRALRNLAVSELRRPGPEALPGEAADVLDPAPGAVEVLAQAEERERAFARLRSALEGLSDPEREALELRYAQGLGYREMAERTGCAISTLQARVEAGLGKIRARIGNQEREA